MMDFYDNPGFVRELLETIAEYNIAQVRRALGFDIDAVYFGDDWGAQHGLQMGPAQWRSFILPVLARMYGEVRRAGKLVMIHSCGDVDELFDDLVGIGLSCFNPFQPEVMDVHALLGAWRGRLAFHGGLSTQRVLPYGSCRGRAEGVAAPAGGGTRGGLYLLPCPRRGGRRAAFEHARVHRRGKGPGRKGGRGDMTRISRGSYKDQDAVILESAQARAVVLPRWGAKLASLVHKGLGVETLWQTEGAAYRRTTYGDGYERGEISGFDEMFPTISRCLYEAAPLSGTEAPDHGEVWTLPWEHSLSESCVRLWVNGVRFPYRLEKEMSLEDGRLVSRYRATNLSGFPLDFIWAAHPLFNAREGMQLIVPRGMDRVVNAVPGPVLPSYGEELSFPVARPRRGAEVRLDTVPAKNPTGWQKYWFRDPVPDGWCMLHDPSSTLTIGMAWPREKVPYLGMWLNEGSWAGQYNIAPEPATAAMDRIDMSKMWGMGSALAAHETREWSLAISLATGKKPGGMTPEGDFLDEDGVRTAP